MRQQNKKQQSFQYGALILMCSTILVKIIGAVFKIPLSRLWADELVFGYFSSAYALFTPIYTIAMAGLPLAVSRFVAECVQQSRHNDVKSALRVSSKLFAIIGIVGTVLMLLVAYPFVCLTDNTGDTIYSIAAIAPSIFFYCIISVYRGYYEGLRNMYPTAISNIIEALGKLVLGLGIAYLILHYTKNEVFSAAGAMAGIVIGSIASMLFLIIRYKLNGDGIIEEELCAAPKPMADKDIAKTILTISIPIVLASLANTIPSFVDVFFVKWQLTEMMSENFDFIKNLYSDCIRGNITHKELPTYLYGVREKAYTIYNLVPTITQVLGISVLPILTACYNKEKSDTSGVKSNIEAVIKFSAIVAMPAGIGCMCLGPEIMSLIYDTAASAKIGGDMLRIYGVAAIFAGLALPMISILQAIGKEKISLRNVVIGSVIKVIVNFIFVGISTINIKGAAIGTLALYLFIFVANILSIIKHTGIVPNAYTTLFKPLCAALVCGVSTIIFDFSFVGKSGVLIEIVISAIIYFISLVIFNTFSSDDVLSLPGGEKMLKVFKKFKIVR